MVELALPLSLTEIERFRFCKTKQIKIIILIITTTTTTTTTAATTTIIIILIILIILKSINRIKDIQTLICE